MKACILLNGKVDNLNFLKKEIQKEKYDYIICADGGANFLYKLDIAPSYIIGDLDSIDFNVKDYFEKKGVDFKKFPSRKDETDAQLCIHLAKELKVNNVDILGALGGRIDHTIANINLMYYIKNLGINPVLKTEKEYVYIVNNESLCILGNKGDTISILPIKDDAKGITLEGLEYPLNNATINFGNPIGISNVMSSNKCRIKVKSGNLLIIKNIEPV